MAKKKEIEKTEEKEEKIVNKKNNNTSKIISIITFIATIAYLAFMVIKVDNIITSIDVLSIPILLLFISGAVFISSLKNENNIIYVIISIIILLFTAFYFVNDIGVIKLPEDEKIISYVDKSYNELKEFTDKNSIKLNIEYEYSDTIIEGNIIRLSVNEGVYVKEISEITATISNGPDYDKLITISSLIGWNIDDVVEYIDENFLSNVVINYEASDDEIDTVIKQSINGEIRRNQELVITVSFGNDTSEKTIEMIDLTNMTKFSALLWLKRNNIKYEISNDFSDSVKKDIVISQDKTVGSEINTANDIVNLSISIGKAVTIPNFTTMTSTEATNWIIENGLKVTFSDVYDESVSVGAIISQSINEGEKVATGTVINIVISKGQIKMENFSSLNEFRTWANKYNIMYNETYEYSNSVSKGDVITYSYNVGDIVDPDGVITVKISLGKAVVIPSFIGKTKSEAESTCNSLGIKCSFSIGYYNNSYATNVVYNQSRSVGSKTTSGSVITLTLSKGIPTTKSLYIDTGCISYGNPTATINCLKTQLSNDAPGVNFNFILKPHNTMAAGVPHPDSPTKSGTSVTQGNTYDIWIVSN